MWSSFFFLCGRSVLFGCECTVFWPEVSRASVRGSDISTLTIFNLPTPLFLSHHTILILPFQGWTNIIAPSCLMQCKYAITDRYSGSQDPSSYYTWLQFLSHRPWVHHLLSTALTTLIEIVLFYILKCIAYHISVVSKSLLSSFQCLPNNGQHHCWILFSVKEEALKRSQLLSLLISRPCDTFTYNSERPPLGRVGLPVQQ